MLGRLFRPLQAHHTIGSNGLYQVVRSCKGRVTECTILASHHPKMQCPTRAQGGLGLHQLV